MENIEKVLAQNVKRLRKEKGWTQDILADNAGLSNFAIQAIEGERSWPVLGTVQKLASALEVSTTSLFQSPKDTTPSNQEILHYLAENLGYEVKKKS